MDILIAVMSAMDALLVVLTIAGMVGIVYEVWWFTC